MNSYWIIDDFFFTNKNDMKKQCKSYFMYMHILYKNALVILGVQYEVFFL